jgi:hypothetical protein
MLDLCRHDKSPCSQPVWAYDARRGIKTVRSFTCVVCSIFLFSLFGCYQSTAVVGSGSVLGGGQPVANATIQLYSVGTADDGAAATPLLTKTIRTDAKGNFSIAGGYSCTAASEVYVTATGGSPGAGLTNANLAMMTALGPCSSVSSMKSIVVNELTTVAAANALAAYMTSYTAVGSGASDVGELNAAFTLASELVDPATGTSPGLEVPSGYTVPVEEIDTLGDVMTTCVNSGGGTAGDGSACGNFFSLTTPPGTPAPTNTIAALLDLAKNPALNTEELYQLTSQAPPYLPVMSGLPVDFAIGLTPATTAGSLELGPTSISFPATPTGSTSGAQDATLMNAGTTAVAVSNVVITGTNSSVFAETNNCPASLAAGASCTIQATFSPVDTSAHSATLQVNGGVLGVALYGGGAPAWPATLLAANPSVYLNFNDQTTSFLDQVSGLAFSSGGGTVMPSQPGFDNTQPNNTSAGFAGNAYSEAPNNTLGAIEWDVPWTMLIHVDRLNWNRTGTLTLASKGDVSSNENSWWQLTLGMVGTSSQLCFTRNGVGGSTAAKGAASGPAQNGICTAGTIDAMPNGYNYDIVLTDSGTGASGSVTYNPGYPSALTIYINGLDNFSIPEVAFSNSYGQGFGSVSLTVSGGTGYANSTAFTSTGGGPQCTVAGTMSAEGGIPSGFSSPVTSPNFGCTSAPTIVLTSPTGTGAVITATPNGELMNSTTEPLMVPGYVSAGNHYGVAGPASTQTSTYVDEFAIFPSAISMATIETMYWETKFYQGLMNQMPATPYNLVFDDDGCGDTDNIYALALAIAAEKIGYIHLAGVVDTNETGVGAAMYRQMLNQAGLEQVPVSVPSVFKVAGSFCTAADIETYDAETGTVTPQTTSAYEPAATMYRTIFAANPTAPVYIMLGGTFRGVSDLMQSPADGISSLTGAQLVARNAMNGGAIFAEGLGANLSVSTDNSNVDWQAGQYVVTHNGSLPIYWYGGTPQPSGPSVLWTRTAEDPVYLLATTMGTDSRNAWDSMPTAALLSSRFAQGVTIAIGGRGSGYANTTAFTSTGGGANCSVTGVMNSVQGVPSTITFNADSPTALSFSGIGWGCTSAPAIVLTEPTGTGAVLTATPTMTCGTVTVVSSSLVTTSTSTCSNHYFLPFSLQAQPNNTPVFQWFLNSLIDPTPNGTP